jgi:putative cardiolipin synthase
VLPVRARLTARSLATSVSAPDRIDMHRGRRLDAMGWRRVLLLLVTSLLAACAGLPSTIPRENSFALPRADVGPLAERVRAALPDPSSSGFQLLPTPEFALDARVAISRHAQQSLDLQYYVIHDDATGRYLLRQVVDAARRGVRVRLLLDDLYTSGEDRFLLAIAAHPNVQVRLFNPFPYGRSNLYTRYAASLMDFGRLNHRMHNKLFIADGIAAVVGGRNIGDEYFLRDKGANFLDLDAFAAGQIVTRLGTLFDEYWNSPYSFPLLSILGSDWDPAPLIDWFDDVTSLSALPPPTPAPNADLLGHVPVSIELEQGPLRLALAHADAFADSPQKVRRSRVAPWLESSEELDSVLYNVRRQVRQAQQEVSETTPYLVPGDEGMQSMRILRERGIRFSIVTNSLAATDEVAVFTAYRRYRRPMLELGVELYEISPSRVQHSGVHFGKFGDSIGRLHAKCAVIDRRTVFIGSMNFDPRSDKHNTELGLFIYSSELAQQLLKLMDVVKAEGSYRLQLASDGSGRIEWVSTAKDGQVLSTEPESTPSRILLLDLLTPFTPEDLL